MKFVNSGLDTIFFLFQYTIQIFIFLSIKIGVIALWFIMKGGVSVDGQSKIIRYLRNIKEHELFIAKIFILFNFVRNLMIFHRMQQSLV